MASNTSLSANIDIDYVAKDFDSVVDALTTFATVNYGSGTSANRLWTDFNADSFSRTWLELVAYVSDLLFFYFDNQATQSYLQTATIRSAVENIAKQFGFTPASSTSSSGVATFTVSGAGTIPRGFRVQASNGEQFFVTNPIIATAAGEVSGSVLQGIIRTEQFVAEGLQNEEFNLVGPNVIRDLDNEIPQDISPQITVDGNTYDLVESFIRQTGEDSAVIRDSLDNIVGGGGRAFTLSERPNGTPFIRFGDGIFGRKLQPGELMTITYRTGGGTVGNIAQDTLTTVLDSSLIITSVTNNADFSGGADEQSIEELRELIPASLRTLDRAVAEQDYSDILTTTFTEVFDASTAANNDDPGIDLNIFVVPQGVGITSITDNAPLKNRLESYIDRRKMVTVQFQILDAFGIDSLVGLEVFITDTASKTTVTQAINDALLSFFSLTTGGPEGSGIGFSADILLKDISDLLEIISGVTRYEIKKLSYRPRIDKQIVGLTSDYNVSEVTIFPNVQEREWLVGASGAVTGSGGTVLYDNTPLTTYSYNQSTGELTYTFPVDLTQVASGDLFRTGAGEEEETDLLCSAFASISDGQYVTVNAATNSTRYAFYLDTTGGNLTIPVVPGHTLVQVDISGDITDIDVATTLAASINGEADFFADNAGGTTNTISVQNIAIGETDDAVNVDIGGVFAVTVTQQGTNAVVDVAILGVGITNSTLFLPEGLFISDTVTISDHGSIRQGATTSETFKVFKKILATTTNLSVDSITDTNLDLSIVRSTGTSLSPRVLIDNTRVFVKDEYATGEFYLVDSQDSIWEIESNESNTFTTSITAVNDAGITQVASGDYRIVTKLTSSQVIFSGNIFNIQYNTDITLFSTGAQFSQIGTIGDAFEISDQQVNTGVLGAGLDLIFYDAGTGKIRLNSSPNLVGITSEYILIDSSGQIFNVTGIDNRALPSVSYILANKSNDFTLKGAGLGSQVAQGFKVTETDTYPVVSFDLKREGNAIGNLSARIVADDGFGLPDLGTTIATSESINLTTIDDSSFNNIVFSFATPPSLTAATQYHLVLNADASYASTQTDGVVAFDNTGLESFTYNPTTGDVVYGGVVSLTNVEAGHFFQDGAGALFKILSVDDGADTLTLADSLTVNTTVATSDDGAVIINDRILVSIDDTAPSYADGEYSHFDGVLWSNSSSGPSQLPTLTVATFSIEGTKSITIESNLTPVLGVGATITKRYYDDENEISFALGLSQGIITSATDVNARGVGTVASVPNRNVDRFIFRTSRYADDIVNLRASEIPQLSVDDIELSIFGGVD